MRIIRVGHVLGEVAEMEIQNRLEDMHAIVGGYIEPCAPIELKQKGIELIANEEGLLAQLQPNENLFPFFIVGDAFFVAFDGEDFVGLSDNQVSIVKAWLASLAELRD